LLAEISEQRLNQAMRAFLRQELQAPATAVTDFLGIIIEDARSNQLNHLLSDLERMHTASVQLNAFVKNFSRTPPQISRMESRSRIFTGGSATTCERR